MTRAVLGGSDWQLYKGQSGMGQAGSRDINLSTHLQLTLLSHHEGFKLSHGKRKC